MSECIPAVLGDGMMNFVAEKTRKERRDAVDTVRGIFAEEMRGGPTIDEMRAIGRAEDAEIEAPETEKRRVPRRPTLRQS
jgi:hypothetical protein